MSEDPLDGGGDGKDPLDGGGDGKDPVVGGGDAKDPPLVVVTWLTFSLAAAMWRSVAGRLCRHRFSTR